MVRAKKYLGQHFLKDLGIARDIAQCLSLKNYSKVLEVGPGMGALTQFLIPLDIEIFVIEIDKESVSYLKKNYPELDNHILEGDFLQLPLKEIFKEPIAVIGNFPYNISSQILFKAIDNKNLITEIVGMFQKEVAERIVSPAGSKKYGILSVLLQCFYDVEYLFTVDETVFDPPPKVKSAVIRLRRNNRNKLDCDEKKFLKLVKTSFGQRRKTLRNALKSLNLVDEISADRYLSLRAEQLSVEDFMNLTNCFE